MTTVLKTAYAKGERPMPTSDDADLLSVRMEYSIAAVLALNDVVELGFLPADHVPVSVKVDHDLLSDSAAGTFNLGILNTGGTAVSTAAADGGAGWITSGAAVLQAAGSEVPGATELGVLRVVPSATASRKIGLVITEGCTGTVTGKIACTLQYRAAHYGA